MWDKIKTILLVIVLCLAFILGVWALWKFILKKFFVTTQSNEVEVSITNPSVKDDFKKAENLQQALDFILNSKLK